MGYVETTDGTNSNRSHMMKPTTCHQWLVHQPNWLTNADGNALRDANLENHETRLQNPFQFLILFVTLHLSNND